MRARYEPLRQRVNAIKVDRGCVDCGYRACAEALEFDHLPGTEKLGAISDLVTARVPWPVMLAEIAKCEVVCANCHRVRTTMRGDPSRNADWDQRKRGESAPVVVIDVEQLSFLIA